MPPIVVREAANYVIKHSLLFKFNEHDAADHALFAVIGLDDYARMDSSEAYNLIDDVAQLSMQIVGSALRQAFYPQF